MGSEIVKSTWGARAEERSPVKLSVNILNRLFEKFEVIVLSYGILLMALNSVANVFGRYLFGQSLYFSEELNQLLIVMITFVGLGYATHQGRHIRMSALYDQLPHRGKKWLMLMICAVTAAVMFLLAYYAFRYVGKVYQLGRVTPALRLPLYLAYLWVPLGFVVTGMHYVLALVRNLQESDVYLSYHVPDVHDTEEDIIKRVSKEYDEEHNEEHKGEASL